MIHFLRPEWLIALLPLALLLWFLRRQQYQSSSWHQYIAPHLANVLVAHQAPGRKQHLGLLGLSWFIAVLALSGPALTKQSLPVFESNLGRVIVMDMSLSMYATDLAPNRLTQAKFKATDLIKSLDEGETGLVAYAGDAFTISPLTRDNATLLNLLPTLSPQIMPVMGSNLPVALTQAKQLLMQGGHLRGDVILLTDGVQDTKVNEAKKVLDDTQYRLSIVALGTRQGAAIRLPDGQLMRDNSDQVVVSKTNFEQLSHLIGANGGKLFTYRADGQDLLALKQSLTHSQDTKATDRKGETWQDLGPYLAMLLLLPALMSFRHLMTVALVCMLTTVPSSPAQADSWQHPFSTDNQRAMRAYQQGDYQAAAQLFDDPNWQAAAHYKNGDYQQALDLYQQDDSAQGLYNQANSLMQLQDYDQAITRYEQALAKSPDLQPAKQNLEIAKQLQAQKNQDNRDEQKNQGNQGDQEQSQPDSQQQQTSSEQGQQSQQDNEGQQEQTERQDQAVADTQQTNKSSDPSDQQAAQENSGSAQQDEPTNDGQQPSQEAPQSGSQPDNEAQMSANPQPSSSDTQNVEPPTNAAHDAADAQADKDSSEADANTGAMNNAIPPEELPPEMQRALTGVVDDPQVLLRNKMQLEYQKRRRQGATSKDNEQW